MKNLNLWFELTNKEHYLNDVQDIPRAFSPYVIVDECAKDFLIVDHSFNNQNIFEATVRSSFAKQKTVQLELSNDNTNQYKKTTKHFLKNMLYDYLCDYLEIDLPYGSLTGVRPTKLYYELLETEMDAKGILKSQYKVSDEKIYLIEKVIETQKGIYSVEQNACDIFINIPFCPTRCNYCSFISCEVSKVKDLLPFYVKAVNREVESIKKTIKERGWTVRSIYVGGGTPTSIGSEHLCNILEPLKDFGVEFTVEAGRPDTIDIESLEAMKRNNVTRISINPQTFNENTLLRIGRKHSIDCIYKAFELAQRYHFDINMDLIALLEGETREDFYNSVDKAIQLEPQNITVHTLSIKRGAVIAQNTKEEFGKASDMVSYAHNKLMQNDYRPYYMYRQKNMADNLENVGFAKKGKECIYNIDMMEETCNILGAGAGAVSKLLYVENKLERIANPKGIKEYLERIDALILKKQ